MDSTVFNGVLESVAGSADSRPLVDSTGYSTGVVRPSLPVLLSITSSDSTRYLTAPSSSGNTRITHQYPTNPDPDEMKLSPSDYAPERSFRKRKAVSYTSQELDDGERVLSKGGSKADKEWVPSMSKRARVKTMAKKAVEDESAEANEQPPPKRARKAKSAPVNGVRVVVDEEEKDDRENKEPQSMKAVPTDINKSAAFPSLDPNATPIFTEPDEARYTIKQIVEDRGSGDDKKIQASRNALEKLWSCERFPKAANAEERVWYANIKAYSRNIAMDSEVRLFLSSSFTGLESFVTGLELNGPFF